MIKHFWVVWKTQLNQTFGFSHLKYLYRTNRRKFIGRMAFIPLILLALLPVLQLIFKVYGSVFNVLHPLGQDQVIFALAFVFTQSLALIFGLFYLMSNFYSARDLDMLIPLPVRPSVILGSKFMIVVISEYAATFPVVLPALLVYGIHTGPPLTFWVLALLITLLLPIIPLALASIFVVLLMRVTNAARGRGVMRITGAFLGVLVYSAIQWLQYRFRNSGPVELEAMLTNPDGLINMLTRRFPPSLWAARGLYNFPEPAGLLNLALYIGATLGAAAFLFLLADRVFYRGLIGGNEVSAKRKKLASTPGDFQARSVFKALFLREWRNLIRSASFLTPVLVNIVILPAAFAVPLLSASKQGILSAGKIQDSDWIQYVIVFAVSGLITLAGTSNSIAVTALSREGKSFWISKTIPAPPFIQILSKFVLAFIVPVFLTVAALTAEALALRFSAMRLVEQAFLALVGSSVTMSFSLFLDLLNPKLNWTDPQQIMKRNLNAIISVFSTMGFVGSSFALIYFLGKGMKFSPGLAYYVVAILWVLLLGTAAWLLFHKAESRYSKIES